MKIDIPLEVIQSMKKIVDMFIEDEKKHYDELWGVDETIIYESGKYAVDSKHHIYNDLELVNRFIHSQELQADVDLAERD